MFKVNLFLVYYMHPGFTNVYNPTTVPSSERGLRIFCYEGKPKYIIYMWQSVVVMI